MLSNIKDVNGITKFKTTLKEVFIRELILHTRRVFWAIMALVLSIAYLKVFIMAYLSIHGLRTFVFFYKLIIYDWFVCTLYFYSSCPN
jgi:hypothetical protein